jgi:methionine salvage enolase-phosphatase E1
MDQFEIGPASASRDLAIYIELAPNNLVLRHENKQYIRSSDFSPIFNHERQQVLASLINGFVGLSIGKKSEEYKFVDSRPIEDFKIAFLGDISRSLNTMKSIKINGESFNINSLRISENGCVLVSLYDKKKSIEFCKNINELS